MSDFIQDDEHEGSGGGNGGEFQFNDYEADAEIARMIAEEIENPIEPEVRPADQVRRERLMGGDDMDLDFSSNPLPISHDPDLEKAIEESRLLYEVEGNLRGGVDPDFEKAIAESIEAQIRHEEEITKIALEEERNKRMAECDLIIRRLKTMFGRKPDLITRVDTLFRAYMECASGPYIYLSPEDHLFFGDLMDYLYTLPSILIGRSILSKEVFERLSKYMVIRDPDITPEDQFFVRTRWVDGMEKSILQERWIILKSIFE